LRAEYWHIGATTIRFDSSRVDEGHFKKDFENKRGEAMST
jgi:hypothetical protein